MYDVSNERVIYTQFFIWQFTLKLTMNIGVFGKVFRIFTGNLLQIYLRIYVRIASGTLLGFLQTFVLGKLQEVLLRFFTRFML